MNFKAGFLALISTAMLTGSAFAQAQRPAAPAATAPAKPAVPGGVSQPDNTTATYGDWIYRCQQGVGTKVCEIVQTLEIQGQRGPVALLAMGRPTRTEPYKLVVQVPANIVIGANAGIRVALGEKDEGTLAAFQRCLPGGCFAEASVSEDMLKRLRAYTEAGQLRYQDGTNRVVTLPFSFRGFVAATDALARE